MRKRSAVEPARGGFKGEIRRDVPGGDSVRDGRRDARRDGVIDNDAGAAGPDRCRGNGARCRRRDVRVRLLSSAQAGTGAKDGVTDELLLVDTAGAGSLGKRARRSPFSYAYESLPFRTAYESSDTAAAA